MAIRTPRVWPDLPIPPGELIEEELEILGMSHGELAVRMNRPPQEVTEIIQAERAITSETAIDLERVLGIDADFWASMEYGYRMTLARNREKEELAGKLHLLDEYPVATMVKLGWLPVERDKSSKLKALMGFLGASDVAPSSYQEAIGFRITDAAKQKISPGALSAWVRKGEIDGQKKEVSDYDADAFRDALAEIRGMTSLSPQSFVPKMSALCAQSGVAFCLVPELPKSGANGVARWLTGHKALLQMNLRNKWADIFWFTFFHEACHILQHRAHRRILIDWFWDDPEMTEVEAEADNFAKDILIPPEHWEMFRSRGNFSVSAVRNFAAFVGIAPFVVVGRLQKEGRVAYSQLAGLKERYQWQNRE